MAQRKWSLFFLLINAALTVCILCGCLAGIGDWSYPLCGGYSLIRFNSHGINLVHQDVGEDTGRIVIENYYVTDYSQGEQYIALKGIPTTNIWASEEELISNIRVFYLVDIKDGTVIGPFHNIEALIGNIGNLSDWHSTSHITAKLQVD